MQYIFLVVAAAWMAQFGLTFWQLRRFHTQLALLRKHGRCAVGMAGSRWRGRVYGVLVLDPHDAIAHAAVFHGWTVFSQLRPVPNLEGTALNTVLATDAPPVGVHPSQWQALQHAGQFLSKIPVASHRATPFPLT